MIDWLDSDLCWTVDSAEAYDYLMEERKRKGSRNESERRKMRDIKKSKEVWKNKNIRIRMRKVKKKKIQKKRMEKTQIRIKTAYAKIHKIYGGKKQYSNKKRRNARKAQSKYRKKGGHEKKTQKYAEKRCGRSTKEAQKRYKKSA